MNTSSKWAMGAVVPMVLLGSFLVRSVTADPPKSSRDIIQKGKAETEKTRVRPPAAPPARPRATRVVVPRKSMRRHIRWTMPLDDRNEVDFNAVLSRSTRNVGFSLDYFDDRRKREIETVVTCFRDGRRDEGYEHWHRFVIGLDTFDKPVDLEPVMYYVLREGCLRQDVNVLFRAERLEWARGDMENLEEYWNDLYRLRHQCREGGNRCDDVVERNLEDEMDVVAEERELARARVGVAERALERAQLTSSGEVTRSVDLFYTVAQEITRRTETVLYAESD